MSKDQNPADSPDRSAFRATHGLRIVTEKEEGGSISRLPDGIYGFTTAPGTDELPVFILPVYQCTEVWKVGGDIHFVGYLTAAQKAAFDAGAEPLSANLYPEPHGDSTALVAIPLSRMDRRRPPARDEGNPMKVDLGPRAIS